MVSAYETTTADETEMKLLKYKLSQIPDINESGMLSNSNSKYLLGQNNIARLDPQM